MRPEISTRSRPRLSTFTAGPSVDERRDEFREVLPSRSSSAAIDGGNQTRVAPPGESLPDALADDDQANDPAADTGAQREQDGVLEPACGSQPGLAEQRRVRVVHHRHGPGRAPDAMRWCCTSPTARR